MDHQIGTVVHYLVMPMYFNSLVVENTNRCNAKCAMCYQSSGPKGSDLYGKASLTVIELQKLIRDAAKIPTLQRRFHLSGGEAFLDINGCVRLFETAHSAGFFDITGVTNGYWAEKPQKAADVCERIARAGVTGLEISWTHWHSEYISATAVSNCLEACSDAGISTNLRVLTSKNHSLDEALSYLRPEAVERATRITSGPVFATGRAARELDRSELYVSKGSLDDNCHSVLNLTVNALGNVYPCCAGLDQTNTFIFGNIRSESIDSIAESMARSPMLRTIVFRGIAALLPIIEKAGIDIGRDFNSICHMCWSIFSRPECVEAIKAHFDDQQQRALLKAITLLETQLQDEQRTEVYEHA